MSEHGMIKEMPKVELHVHLEGSIRPETVLKLAKRNGIALPADTVEGLQTWYTFRDFPHFVQVYVAVSQCIRTADDIELVAREFLEGQKQQNILHSEVTYTASTIEKYAEIPWSSQLKALENAKHYGEEELGISCGFILDIVRGDPPARALEVAQWAVDGMGSAVCALGLAGEERLGNCGYEPAFDLAHEHGLSVTVHAGETCGPESIRETLAVARPHRIGHGVRCLEDSELASFLLEKQIPLEVCPTSNLRLGVFPTIEEHPLARLIEMGMNVSINSDDPPMFGTTLTHELELAHQYCGASLTKLHALTLQAARVSFLTPEKKARLISDLEAREPGFLPPAPPNAHRN